MGTIKPAINHLSSNTGIPKTTETKPSTTGTHHARSGRESKTDSSDEPTSESHRASLMADLKEEMAIQDAYKKSIINSRLELSDRKDELSHSGKKSFLPKFKTAAQKNELASIAFQEKSLLTMRRRVDGRLAAQETVFNALSRTSDAELSQIQFFKREPTKYAKTHHVFFQADNKIQDMFRDDMVYRGHHEYQKGVSQRSSHMIDVESLGDRSAAFNPQLRDQLSTIPVGEDTKGDDVSHTKIMLESHGHENGTLSVNSGTTGKRKNINPGDIGEFLSQHLTNGDYGGKLTIALRSCYGGLGEDSSPLTAIANTLERNGNIGIKLTGSKEANAISSSISFDSAMGSATTRGDDGSLEKFSTSDNKVVIHIPSQLG